MLILLINNGEKKKEFYDKMLAFVALKDEIIEVDSIQKAQEFIVSQLVLGSKKSKFLELSPALKGNRIDLIVTNFAFGDDIKSAIDLMLWLKSDDEAVYYQSSLLLMSLPIILVNTTSSTTKTDALLGFDSIVYSKDLDSPLRIKYVVERTIKSWVDKILHDYDLLRADPRVPYLYGPLVWNSNCEVLSRAYALYPRRLPFLVFKRDFDAAESAIEDFFNTVVRISSEKKATQEILYHNLLKKYPEFLLGSTYDGYIHEGVFRNSRTRNTKYKPDFIRRHRFYGFNNVASILELKLPNDKIIAGNPIDFHPGFSGRANHALDQVRDYRDYFNDRSYDEIIKERLGYVPNMSHSFLLGRSSEKDIHMELIEKRLKQSYSSDIVLVTYDELIKQRSDLLDRSRFYHMY